MRLNPFLLFGVYALLSGCVAYERSQLRPSIRYLKETRVDVSFALCGPSLDRYYAEMERFYDRPDADMWSQYAFQDSLFATGEFFPDLERHYDRDYVSEEFLRHRVEDALEQWHTSPFARELDFKDFCEYLLPYRVGTEELEEWWTDYRAWLGPVMDSVVARPGVTLAEFCEAFNGFFSEMDRSYTGYPAGKPSFKPSSLKRILGGTCDDYRAIFIYAARSYGIPVATDFTPQWGNHSQGHSWSVAIQGDSTYHYMVSEPPFLAREKPFTWRLVKAYRRMESVQPGSLGARAKTTEIPPSLRDPRIRDVTRLYMNVSSVRVGNLRKEGKGRYVFLSCFNDQGWTPISGVRCKGTDTTFPDMGRDCVYLPTYYSGGGLTPAQWPLLVDSTGRVRQLVPDLKRQEHMHLTRKFMDVRARQFADSLLGGRFELADNEAFKDAYRIEIPDTVGMNYQTAPVPQDREFRYVRYIPKSGTSGNIAEIELYDQNGKQLTGGKVIGTYAPRDKFHPMSNVFDGDVLSYASCSPSQQEMPWVGLDLGRSIEISKLCYLPRTDDNFIREGDEYELCYWDGDGWASLGRKTGSRATQELVYDNVPANALLLLHNHTKGKEERIFTYENGRQVWW